MKRIQIYFLMFLAVSLFSCADEQVTMKNIHGYILSSSSDKYLATDDELTEAKHFSKDIVNWQVARSFAVKELNENTDYSRWDNATLSDKPIIIYDNMGAPLYYEFRVRKG